MHNDYNDTLPSYSNQSSVLVIGRLPSLGGSKRKSTERALEKGLCLQLDSLRIEIWGGFYNCVFHLLLLYNQQIQRKSADEQKESWKWQKDKKKIIVQRKKFLSCKVAWKLPYHLGEKSPKKISFYSRIRTLKHSKFLENGFNYVILVKNATISQWFLNTVANSFSLFLGSIVVDVFVILLY